MRRRKKGKKKWEREETVPNHFGLNESFLWTSFFGVMATRHLIRTLTSSVCDVVHDFGTRKNLRKRKRRLGLEKFVANLFGLRTNWKISVHDQVQSHGITSMMRTVTINDFGTSRNIGICPTSGTRKNRIKNKGGRKWERESKRERERRGGGKMNWDFEKLLADLFGLGNHLQDFSPHLLPRSPSSPPLAIRSTSITLLFSISRIYGGNA